MDKKISELTEKTSIGADDFFILAEDLGGGLFGNRKVRFSNVMPSGVALPSGMILDTGNQTIGGIKTFTSFPVLPVGIPVDNEAVSSAYLANQLISVVPSGVVFVYGDQVVGGIKTYTSFPVSPSGYPNADFQMANKKYVDDNSGGVSADSVIGIMLSTL